MCTKRLAGTLTAVPEQTQLTSSMQVNRVKSQTHTFATQSLFPPIMSYKEPASKGSCTWSRKRRTNTDDLQMLPSCSTMLSNSPPSPLSWLSPVGRKAADLPKPQRSRALERINPHQLETASRKLKEAVKSLTHHNSIQADVCVNTSVN